MTALAPLAAPANSDPWYRHPFVTYLARLGNELTRRQNTSRGNRLASWLSNGVHNAMTFPWHEMKYEELVVLRAGLGERYAPGTANNYLAVLRGVAKEAWRLKLIDGATYRRIADIPGIAGEVPPAGRHVEIDELHHMLCLAEQEGSLKATRDIAILVTLYGTGMRCAELAHLTTRDYDPHEPSFKVVGKGNRRRENYAAPWVREPVASWLEVRTDAPGALFVPIVRTRVDPTYSHLSTMAVLRVVKIWAKRAGLEPVTTHDYRRTNIGNLIDSGVDLVTIGRNVGQKDPKTTAAYDRRKHQAIKAATKELISPF